MTENEQKDLLLIVDDEEDIRLNLCDYVEMEGYSYVEANNGINALKILEKNEPTIIITDLMMPEMGGLELLEALSKRDNKIPVVIMTAFGTIDYAVKAMKSGAQDFITKPIDYDLMLNVIQRVIRASKLEQKVLEQQRQMEADLKLAGVIQKALLPKPIDNSKIILDYQFEPMIEIGGDQLNVHVYDEDHIAITLFDVTGHGISAALVANMVHNELIRRIQEDRPPLNVAEHLHRFVLKSIGDTGMFLTLVILDIDLMTKTLTLCNAGHPDVLIWNQKKQALNSIKAHIPPIGFPSPFDCDVPEARLSLNPGDRIILYTDGFTETKVDSHAILGQEKFKEVVEQCIRYRVVDFIKEIYRMTNEMNIEDEADDDRTLALIEIK